MKRKQITRDQARIRLEELCVRGEQCRADLVAKLSRWGVATPYDDILDSLAERRFFDDARFARAYVRDKYRFDRWGRMKIVSSLIAKRISRSDIDAALSEIDIKEYARNCYSILLSRRRQLPADMSPYERRQRLLRSAAQRGYEPSLIIKLLDNAKLWDGETD